MYKIPLSNYPNQSFTCNIPINGENVNLKFSLWYNYQAKYWLMSLSDVKTETTLFYNLPLLSSKGKFRDLFCQLGYLHIGMSIMLPVVEDQSSMANDKNLGTSYVMIWGDNDE